MPRLRQHEVGAILGPMPLRALEDACSSWRVEGGRSLAPFLKALENAYSSSCVELAG